MPNQPLTPAEVWLRAWLASVSAGNRSTIAVVMADSCLDAYLKRFEDTAHPTKTNQ